MNSSVKKLIWVFLFSVIILSGCADMLVNLAYLPEALKKSPLSTLKPMTVALQLEDQRNPNESDRLGDDCKNAYGMVFCKVKSNEEVKMVIYDALKNELRNNGHKLVDTKEEQPDVKIYVRLKKYWADHRVGSEMTGMMNADIMVINPRDDSTLLSKQIASTFRQSHHFVFKGAYESILNGVLAEFVRDFFYDPSILKALQLSHKEKEGA